LEAVTILESGFINDFLRTLDGIDSEMLFAYCADAEAGGDSFLKLASSSSEPSFNLCSDGDCDDGWDTGGVGYECSPLGRGFSGARARGSPIRSFDWNGRVSGCSFS
jgi:hypothetical protein